MDDAHLRSLIYRHAIASRSLGSTMAGNFVRQLNAVDEDLLKEIAARYARIEANGFDRGPATTKRLEEMLKAVRALNREVYTQASQGLVANLEKMATQEASFALSAAKASGVRFVNTLPSASFFKTLVQTTPLPFSDDGHTLLMPWLSVQEAGRLRRLEGALRTGIFQGQTTADLVKKISGTRTETGILETSRKDATTIALTANSSIQNEARLDTFKRMKSIKFVEWSSILDSRTSQICQSRSGTIYQIDEPHPKAPAHPRCRSLLLPRRDDAGNKHQPFGDWLQEQPEDIQNEILGKERADIFRQNPEMDFGKFFKENGSYKTLQELRDFDEKITTSAPKADPVTDPVVETKPERFSPINRSITEEAIKIEKRSALAKRLDVSLSEAAQHPQYQISPIPEYKGIKISQFGKTEWPTGMTDATASMISAIMPELDVIADRFAIPRLRGIRKVTSSRAAGDMGDGTMGFNADAFNRMSKRNTKAVDTSKLDELKNEVERQAALFKDYRDQLLAATDPAVKADLYTKYSAASDAYKKAAKQYDKLRKDARKADLAGAHVASEWKMGDDMDKMPFVTTDFFEGIDQARSIMYHEMAHHVHQMYRKTAPRYTTAPPLEFELRTLFAEKMKAGTLKSTNASKYSLTNQHEWFAENFSLYMMDRLDLVDPDAITLIERLLKEND